MSAVVKAHIAPAERQDAVFATGVGSGVNIFSSNIKPKFQAGVFRIQGAFLTDAQLSIVITDGTNTLVKDIGGGTLGVISVVFGVRREIDGENMEYNFRQDQAANTVYLIVEEVEGGWI